MGQDFLDSTQYLKQAVATNIDEIRAKHNKL